MTWQWVINLAMQGIEVTALVNRADPTSPIDPRTASLPVQIRLDSAPKFINVESPVLSRRLPVALYTAVDYQRWQRRALRTARILHKDEPFDVVHHVSWASIHHGSQLHRLDAPFVLGPVGGGVTTSAGYRSCFPNSWRYEQLRNTMVRGIRFNPISRRLIRSASISLASNPETEKVLRQLGAQQVTSMVDDGVDPSELMDRPVEQSTAGPLRVLWVSRIMERKALGMALDAIEKAATVCPVRLTLMGDGIPRALVADQLERMTSGGLLIDRGWSTQAELEAAYSSHDVLLFNSVRDNGSAPLHSASAHGMPAIVLNHQGPGIITRPDWAVQIKPSTTRRSTQDIAEALIELAGDPSRRKQMGQAALAAGYRNTWPERAATMAELYQRVLR